MTQQQPNISCEPIRMHTVISSLDRLAMVLAAVADATTLEQALALARDAEQCLSNATGQLNCWRQQSDESYQRYLQESDRSGSGNNVNVHFDVENGVRAHTMQWELNEQPISDPPQDQAGLVLLPLLAPQTTVCVSIRNGDTVFNDMDQLRAWVESERGDADSMRLTVRKWTDDILRHQVIASGWKIQYDTARSAILAAAEQSVAIQARIKQEIELRSGRQREDIALLCDQTPQITREKLFHPENDGVAVRIRSEGFGSMVEESIEELVGQHATEVLYVADALGAGYVGSWQGPLQEMCYVIDGTRFYMYFVTMQGDVDTWCQEWWTSKTRLSAHAAGEAITAARQQAYKFD